MKRQRQSEDVFGDEDSRLSPKAAATAAAEFEAPPVAEMDLAGCRAATAEPRADTEQQRPSAGRGAAQRCRNAGETPGYANAVEQVPRAMPKRRSGAADASEITPHAKKKTKKVEPKLRRKNSFEHTLGQGATMGGSDAEPPHTLICGTFPSEVSFDADCYYANRTNAFWWIVGDAFGHRRATSSEAAEPVSEPPSNITPRHATPLRSYSEQLEELKRRGFVLWDVLGALPRVFCLESMLPRACGALRPERFSCRRVKPCSER